MAAMRTRLVAGLVTALLLAPLAGCSDGPGGSGGSGDASGLSISADSLEEQLADALEGDVGQRPDAVDCPGDLEGEVGATQRCTLTAGADELGVDVTVTGVEGTDVDFDYVVEEMTS